MGTLTKAILQGSVEGSWKIGIGYHRGLRRSEMTENWHTQQTHNVPLTLAQGYILVTEF